MQTKSNLSYCLYYYAWITHSNGVRRYVFSHYTSCADGYVIADGHARQDSDAATNPHIVADVDRLCPLPTTVALHRVCAVTGGVDANIGANEAVIADSDSCFIEDCEVEVRKEPLAHTDLLAIVAVERLDNEYFIISDMPQQSFQNLLSIDGRM